MRCNKQPRFLEDKPVAIAHILEVRLAPLHWNRIKFTAARRRRTYSTITRYCTLRLARKCSLHWTRLLRQKTHDVAHGLRIAQNLHRHMMCLYGEDEKIIRLAAMELGLTLTAFVRLALELYLPSLAMENHSQGAITGTDLTWDAIRLTKEVQIFAVNGGSRPFYRNLACLPFGIDTYW
jgi:hypothetical protein